MAQVTCPHQILSIILALLGVMHLAFEYWLGKTDKLKANSTLELVFTAVLCVVAFLKKGKENDRTKTG